MSPSSSPGSSSGDFTAGLRSQRIGILLSVIAIVSGFVLGGVFGAWEDSLKGRLAHSTREVLDTVYEGNEDVVKPVVDKAWSYYKRAHLHWGSIGAATLAISILLAGVMGTSIAARMASLAMGIGAVFYPAFWLLAGQRAPAMGGTGYAKNSLEWLAVPSSGLLLLGSAGALVLLAARLFGSEPD